jgi:hypothetical protein
VLGREQLYDLVQDQGETVNLAGDPRCSGVIVRMRQRLRAMEARLSPRPLGNGRAITTAVEWSRQTLAQWSKLMPADSVAHGSIEGGSNDYHFSHGTM